MARSMFGWSYPPGAANDPFAPYNQEDGPCEICGNCVEDCLCPECPVCGQQGEAQCYVEHGMQRTEEQKASFYKWQKQWADEAAAEEAYYNDMALRHGHGDYGDEGF